MVLAVFPFVNHTPVHRYPKGDAFQFGKGYEFSAAPQEPLQKRFVLKFNALTWYFTGTTPVNNVDVENNAMAFDEFYRAHLTHKKFLYNHQLFGQITVKFAPDTPFEMPRSIDGGGGVTEGFEVTLVEQPL